MGEAVFVQDCALIPAMAEEDQAGDTSHTEMFPEVPSFPLHKARVACRMRAMLRESQMRPARPPLPGGSLACHSNALRQSGALSRRR